MYAIIACRFQIWHFFESMSILAFCPSSNASNSFLMWLIPLAFLLCFILVAIFCFKIALLSLRQVVGTCSFHLPLLLIEFFSLYFGMSFFVSIVLPWLDIFLMFLLSPILSGILFIRVVSSYLLVLIFPFRLSMFQRFLFFCFVLSLLLCWFLTGVSSQIFHAGFEFMFVV